MRLTSTVVNNFQNDLKLLDLWDSFRVRSYLLKDADNESFNIVLMRLHLTNGLKSYSRIRSSDLAMMVEEWHSIKDFDRFIHSLSSPNSLNSHSVSMKLLDEPWRSDLLTASIAGDYYNIRYPCLRLMAPGRRTRLLDETERALQTVKFGRKIFLNINDACKRILNLEYSQSTSPHIIVIAPIQTRIQLARSTASNLCIRIICHKKIKKKKIELLAYHLDTRNVPLGSAKINLRTVKSRGHWNIWEASTKKNPQSVYSRVILRYCGKPLEESLVSR